MNINIENSIDLQSEINLLVFNKSSNLSYNFYKKLITEAVNQKEFAATIYIFDHMKEHNKPGDDIYNIINKLLLIMDHQPCESHESKLGLIFRGV